MENEELVSELFLNNVLVWEEGTSSKEGGGGRVEDRRRYDQLKSFDGGNGDKVGKTVRRV